jgi:hypothetical protein
MALSKTPTRVIDNQTIGNNNKVDQATGTDLTAAINLKVGYSMTFNASATAGAKVELYADPADASASFSIGTYDVPIDAEDIARSVGHTVNGSVQMNWSAKFVKVRLVNLDPTYSITAASAWITVQTP